MDINKFNIEEVMLRDSFHRLHKTGNLMQEFELGKNNWYVLISIEQFIDNGIPMVRCVWQQKDILKKSTRFCNICHRNMLECRCHPNCRSRTDVYIAPTSRNPKLQQKIFKMYEK